MNPRALRFAAAALLLVALRLAKIPAAPRLSLCGFHWLTGCPCPLCGLTRGVIAIAQGHLRDATRFNALAPLGFLLLLSLFWDFRCRGPLWSTGALACGIYGVARLLLPGI